MRTTAREMIRGVSLILDQLSVLDNIDQDVEVTLTKHGILVQVVDESPTYNNTLFVTIQTDSHDVMEGDLVSFNYIDKKGERTARVGFVSRAENQTEGLMYRVYDLTVADHRSFYAHSMYNVDRLCAIE